MKDLEIKYDRGVMVIHLEEFLACRSISKVRKLLKIIQRSRTPEMIEQMQQEIAVGVKSICADIDETTKRTIILEKRKQILESYIIFYKNIRSKVSKQEWKEYSKLLNASKEKLKIIKRDLNIEKLMLSRYIKDKVFYERLLSEMFS